MPPAKLRRRPPRTTPEPTTTPNPRPRAIPTRNPSSSQPATRRRRMALQSRQRPERSTLRRRPTPAREPPRTNSPRRYRTRSARSRQRSASSPRATRAEVPPSVGRSSLSHRLPPPRSRLVHHAARGALSRFASPAPIARRAHGYLGEPRSYGPSPCVPPRPNGHGVAVAEHSGSARTSARETGANDNGVPGP